MTFMALGNTPSASRAVGQVQDEPYYMVVEAIATDLGLEIQRHVWRRFVDVTAEAGVVDKTGEGLGVVACDLDGNGRVDLFIHGPGC